MGKVACIIPARMDSSRFPGKPLEKLLGLELLLHVYERCKLCRKIDRIIIATCDKEIKELCEAKGSEVVMTSANHPGCVDRTQEAVSLVCDDLDGEDLVLMVQGDEVLISPGMIDEVIAVFRKSSQPIINLASRISNQFDHDDPNIVKVAISIEGRALFFSRAPIPSRSRESLAPLFAQTGVIGFSRAFLDKFRNMPQSPLEKIEGIDMLRALEHGYPIQIVTTETSIIGVDTLADKVRAEKMLASDPITQIYLQA